MKIFITLLLIMVIPVCQVSAATVELVWDPSPESTVTQYRLVWGNYSGNIVNMPFTNQTTITVPRTTAAVSVPNTAGTWYFRVRVETAEGLSSLWSNVARWWMVRVPEKLRFQRIDLR